MKRFKSLLVFLIVISFNASSAKAATFTAEGTLSGVSDFTTRVFNTADGSTNVAGVLGFNAAARIAFVSSPQAIQIDFEDNNVGNQAIRVKTANAGDVQGLIGVTDPTVNVPLMWVVSDNPISAPPSNNYTFAGDTTREAFVLDDSDVAIATYANIAFSIDGRNASLANFPNDDGAGHFRQATDGQIWVYFGANYTGKPAQQYRTTNLIIELYTQP